MKGTAAAVKHTMQTVLITALLVLCWLPGSVLAACVCGSDDGLLTLTSISIDGDMSDWAPVLADPENVACDGSQGDGLDRDPGATGRDLTMFAFTWDGSWLYMYTERYGQSSNVNNFIYYADTDNDGLMETGEPVIGAVWKGTNRNVEIYIGTYVAVAATGDAMVDGSGLADGYSLPGTITGMPKDPNYAGTWGSADGLSMELAIAWSDLDIAAGTAHTIHVSATNNSFETITKPEDQIDDNMGGCGGATGSTQFADLLFAGANTLQGIKGAVVFGPHTLTNQGNGTDTFNLAYAVTGDHIPTVEYYLDADASGTLSAGDALFTDSDGDGNPDTGPMAPAASLDVLIVYTIADNGPGDPAGIASVDTTATSAFNPAVSATVTDTVEVVIFPDLLVLKTSQVISDPTGGANPKAIPGALVEYTLQVSNQGEGPADLDTVAITDAIPAGSAIYLGDIGGAGSGPVLFSDSSSGLSYTYDGLTDGSDDLEFSSDPAGVDFSHPPSADGNGVDTSVTYIRVKPKGTLAGYDGVTLPQFTIRFQVRVQ